MMASASVPSQGDTKVGTITKENFNPQGQISEREKFLVETGECQAILEDLVEKDEVLSLEQLDKMESAMCPSLLQGFFLMKQRQLTSQEYYQACMTILLARLFEHGGKPSSIVASLRNCLGANKNSSKNGAATTSHGYASLFSLIMDHSQEHPGLNLEEWAHIMGLVSTIQSNVYVVSKRRQLKKQRKDVQHSRSLASSVTNRISYDSLDAMWVIPLSYVVGYVVYDSCCTQQEQECRTLFWSWKRDIRPKIETILFTAFPRLRPTDYVDAGLMILQLDLLQNDNKRMSEVINTASVVEDLLQDNLLNPMVAATDLPKYALLARCCQVFLSRLDTDDTVQIVQACTQLLCKQNPLAYINQLGNPETPIQENRTDALVAPVLGELSYEPDKAVKEETLTHRDRLLSPAYPLLTQIDTLLVDDNVDQAINIVVKMETCAILCEDEKIQGWCRIFHYLFQTGQIFLDGKVHRQEYMAIRKIILEKIVTRAGSLGMSVFLDSYENLLEKIAENKEISNEEHTYIRRACHQTVLRILQAKHNEEDGMDAFQKTYWKNIEKLKAPPGASGLMWSSLSLSSSREEQLNWACRLLTEANPVPETMKFADSPFPDLMSLLRRGEPQPMMLEAEPSWNVNEAPISEKVVGTTLRTAGEKPTEDNKIENVPNNATIMKASVPEEDQLAQDSDENESVVEIVDNSYDEDGEGAQDIVPREESAAEDHSETADEESVIELFADQEGEESSENEDEDQQARSKEAEVMVELGDDEHGEYDEDGSYSIDVVAEQKEVVVEAAFGHSAVETGYEVASQTGYEPEGTEGEVSEAIHTEDEEEERRELQMNRQTEMTQSEKVKELPKRPIKCVQHTLSDMDFADERTTEHEEDLGAESSELDEREATGVAPQSLVTTHGKAGEAPTLMDFAVRAQQQAESRSSHSPQVDTVRSPGRPWHWGSSSPQQEESIEPPQPGRPDAYSIAGDTNAAHAGNSAVSFLGDTSYYEVSEEEKGELPGQHQVVLDNVPEALQKPGPSETYHDGMNQEQQETPFQGGSHTLAEGHEAPPLPREGNELLSEHAEEGSMDDESLPRSKSTAEEFPSVRDKDKSVGPASYAETNAAYAGSLSFTNSPNYPPTEEEGDDVESSQKVIVDPLPEVLGDSKDNPSQQAMEIADAKPAGKRPGDAPGVSPVYDEEDHEVEETTTHVQAVSGAAEVGQYAQAGIYAAENEKEMSIAGHRKKTIAEDNDGSDGELQEELTMAQLADSGGMTTPTTPKGKASDSARSPKDSNSTLQGKSIDVPSQLMSPGMSSVATSVDDSTTRSPPRMPFLPERSRETSNEEEADTKAASETSRRSKRASEMPSPAKSARKPSSKEGLGKRAAAADPDEASPRRRKAAKKAISGVDEADFGSAVQLEQSPTPAKRRRGRPRKAGSLESPTGRGLPPKSKDAMGKPTSTKRGPSRPRKSKKDATSAGTSRSSGTTKQTRTNLSSPTETESRRGRKIKELQNDGQHEEGETPETEDTEAEGHTDAVRSMTIAKTSRGGKETNSVGEAKRGDDADGEVPGKEEEKPMDRRARAKKTPGDTDESTTNTETIPRLARALRTENQDDNKTDQEEEAGESQSTRRSTRRARTESKSDKTPASRPRRSTRKADKEALAGESEADDGTTGTRSTRRSTRQASKSEADDGTTGTRSTRRSTRQASKSEADDGTTGTLSTRRSTRQAAKRAGQQSKKSEDSSQGEDDEGLLSIASRRKTRRATKRASDVDGDEETETKARSTRKRAISVSEEQENETRNAQEKPTRGTKSRAAPKKKRKTAAAAAAESDLPVIPEDIEIDAPASPTETRRSGRTKKPKEKEEVVDQEEEDPSSKRVTRATRGKGSKSSGGSAGTPAENTKGRRKKVAAREDDENESVANSATSSVRRSSRRNKGQRK